jgi:hypothetical protein
MSEVEDGQFFRWANVHLIIAGRTYLRRGYMDSVKLNKRAMVVFFMLFSSAILPFSGVVLHDAVLHDSERLKFVPMAFHNIAAIVFAVSAVIHMKYNWNPWKMNGETFTLLA